MSTKQVIVYRKELNLRKGKIGAQFGHAVIAFLETQIMPQLDADVDDTQEVFTIKLNKSQKTWFRNHTKKIGLQVVTEADLINVHETAQNAGLESHLIIDSGFTEFHGVPTRTCLSIGPDFSEKIDPITGSLELY